MSVAKIARKNMQKIDCWEDVNELVRAQLAWTCFEITQDLFIFYACNFLTEELKVLCLLSGGLFNSRCRLPWVYSFPCWHKRVCFYFPFRFRTVTEMFLTSYLVDDALPFDLDSLFLLMLQFDFCHRDHLIKTQQCDKMKRTVNFFWDFFVNVTLALSTD